MNPYIYTDPPDSAEVSVIQMKYPTLSIKTFHTHRQENRKTSYITFLLGIAIGFIFVNFISFHLLTSICSFELPRKLSGNIYRSENVIKHTLVAKNKKNLVFIGVMTANMYLKNRAKSVYETWGRQVPGKIAFFTSESSEIIEDLPVIRLKGVTDVYPPQKKSFMMLKYMYDNHINEFEFFMRTDDDIYVRTGRLEKFLKSLNSSRPYYIGQAGIGNSEDFGRLALQNKENFCMGGPGVILSKFTLEKVAPYVRQCFENMRSTHEDVEVGRCVQKYAGIPCTWSYEMQNIFYHNYSGSEAFARSLKQKEVHRAITMHPIKDPFHLRRVDSYVKSLMLKEKEHELVKAMRELHRLTHDLNSSPLPPTDDIENGVFSKQIGNTQGAHTNDPKSVQLWDFVSRNVYRLKDENPKHKIPSYIDEGVSDVTREIMEIINRLSKERGRLIDFKDLLYGYHRNDPLSSSFYTLDMLLLYKKYRGKKMTVPVRRHAYIEMPYGLLLVRESRQQAMQREQQASSYIDMISSFMKRNLPFKKEISLRGSPIAKQKRINFILPLSGRFSVFQRFIDDFRRVCLESSENVSLVVVSFLPKRGETDTRDLVDTLLKSIRYDYPAVPVIHAKRNKLFARALALNIGASYCDPDDLMFFVDVDMTFTRDALDRIRWHTVQGKQIYFPAVYSEHDSSALGGSAGRTGKDDHFLINEDLGFWRTFGYGIGSLYLSDLRRIGGLNTSIIGWGKEDVYLLDKAIMDKNIRVVRMPDPDLVHIFHDVDCDTSLEADQYEMCQGSLFNTYASPHSLARIIRSNPRILEAQSNNNNS